MNNTTLNEQTNEDVFIIDRAQPQQPRQRPSTPPPNYQLNNPVRNPFIYEIIKTEDQHVVLVHEREPKNAINNENERRVIGRFTTDNTGIPDDVFVSPISDCSSSEGYWSGSSWGSSSTWRSYDSMRDDLPTLFDTAIQSISQFLHSVGTGQRSRGQQLK